MHIILDHSSSKRSTGTHIQRNLRLEAGRKQLALKLAKVKAGAAGGPTGDGGEYGISWGFDDDAVAEEDDEDGEEGMEGADGEVGNLGPPTILFPVHFLMSAYGRHSFVFRLFVAPYAALLEWCVLLKAMAASAALVEASSVWIKVDLAIQLLSTDGWIHNVLALVGHLFVIFDENLKKKVLPCKYSHRVPYDDL